MGFLSFNLKIMRKKLGLTQKQLGERIGRGETTIDSIETGYLTCPPENIMKPLSEALGTTIQGLMGERPLDVGERSRLIYVADSISNEKPFLELDRVVDGIFLDREKLGGYNYIGLRIKDNSMEDASIRKGATVVIRLNAILKNGDIVLCVCKDYEGIVRRYYKNGNEITLRAENRSNTYPDIKIDAENERYSVMGKVVKIMLDVE